ncbi:hypothetical protein J3F84DRAFT_105024 [Trichoderma pleuroticola]
MAVGAVANHSRAKFDTRLGCTQVADDGWALVGLKLETPVPDTWHGLAPSPTLLGLGGGGQQMLSQPSCDGASERDMGCPLAKIRPEQLTYRWPLGRAAGMGSRLKVVPHMCEGASQKRCFIPCLAVPSVVCTVFFFSFLLQYTALMPWACMTKDDEVSSIAFNGPFRPQTIRLRIGGRRRGAPGFGGGFRRKREDEDAEQMPKRGEAKRSRKSDLKKKS